jgi:molybdopterin-guanine dinucleotide biosynthesis protein A
MTSTPFGAILAGGRNSRYGSHKALATIAGRPIIERARTALMTVTPDLILIANEPELYEPVGLPIRPDAVPGLGALGGIHSALLWARDEGRPGVLAVACDMPFLEPRLLARLVHDAATAEIVVPESGGRRGIEPLCAYYSVGCIPAIEAAIGRGDHRVIAFYDELRVSRVPLAEVHAVGDPAVLFLNVNTPEARVRAEEIARLEGSGEND